MRFWDSSAIIPLLTAEPRSSQVQRLMQSDDQVAVWWSTLVECWSALARLQREGVISTDAEDNGGKVLSALGAAWFEIAPAEEVRLQARRVVRLHKLRAADALQLAAALIWRGQFDAEEFVSFDHRLREAARLEGFVLV